MERESRGRTALRRLGLGGRTARTAGAWFTDSAAVGSNTFTTGTWGP